MDEKTAKELERIASKDIVELTKADIAFLKARQSYLSYTHKDKFADILKPKTIKPKTKKK